MKRLNAQALKHPTTQDKIIDGLINASESAKASPDGRGSVYINAANGSPMFRLDVYAKAGKPEVLAFRGNIQQQTAIAEAMGVRDLAELIA